MKYLITPWWAQEVTDIKISYQIHIRHFVLYFPDLLNVSRFLLVSVTPRLNRYNRLSNNQMCANTIISSCARGMESPLNPH